MSVVGGREIPSGDGGSAGRRVRRIAAAAAAAAGAFAAFALAVPAGCSRSSGGQRADGSEVAPVEIAETAEVAGPTGSADVAAGLALAPVCRPSGVPIPVSPEDVGGSDPSLAWGPGVVGVAYVRDAGSRSLVTVARIVDGVPSGDPVVVGEGAARDGTAIAWDGASFVFAWGEPTDLVTEVFVGIVDAVGKVRWNASRLTETLRSGRWRSPGRTTVASTDPRVLRVGDALALSWRTHAYPEAQPLFFASVRGLEVSSPVIVSGESDSVLDHRLVAWGDAAAAVYTGRFQRTQRLVRVARLSLSPPSVLDDWMVGELAEVPEWFEIAATTVGPDLAVLWRVKTDWDSTTNVTMARVGEGGPARSPLPGTPLEGVLAATPRVSRPHRTFAAAASDRGFVVAWAIQGDAEAGTSGELRIGLFDGDGKSLGEPARIPTDVRLARDPAVVAGQGGEIWYSYVYGEPPAERGRVLLGSVICGD